MKQVLLSCIGTSDPVRGEQDGPMLHILRRHRPEKVYLLLSKEIRGLEEKDQRIEKTRLWIEEHWGGYQPVFYCLDFDETEVFDLDKLDAPLREAMERVSHENPDAEVLLNLSSGTPQMQMLFSQFAMDTRYRARAVYVLNPSGKAGTAMRTNDPRWNPDEALAGNQDEKTPYDPAEDKRTVEPKLLAVRREYLRRQIETLLEARDFEAVEALRESLPENLRPLVCHLAARSRLHEEKARRFARQAEALSLPFPLYPGQSRGEIEYYLRMKNLAAVGDCTAFLLHLEPLTVRLQLALLDRLLSPVCRTDAFIFSSGTCLVFDPDRLRKAAPALYRHYEQLLSQKGWTVKKANLSTYLCDDLLSFFPAEPEAARKLFSRYGRLKTPRNGLAHMLRAVTEDDIRAACGLGMDGLLAELEAGILACCPGCDPAVFSVYDRSIRFIKDNL